MVGVGVGVVVGVRVPIGTPEVLHQAGLRPIAMVSVPQLSLLAPPPRIGLAVIAERR